MATLQIGEMTILQAVEDATGWRPEMDAAQTTTGAAGQRLTCQWSPR